MTSISESIVDGEAAEAESGMLSPGWVFTGVDALVSERAWVDAMLEVELALARAQADLGVVPASTAAAIAHVRHRRVIRPHDLAPGVHRTGNPVVALVARLTEEVRMVDPDAAEYVHRGCTSQDVLDSATMLIAARVLGYLGDALTRCADALALLVERYAATPMAGRTLTQHAVPITFGLKASGWLQLVLDARERVDRLRNGKLPASLGGAAGTLAAYGEYARQAGVTGADGTELLAPFAAYLGLGTPLVPWHAARTPVADLAAAAVFTTGALGKFGRDVRVMCRTEIGELSEPTAPGRGASSTMPQKSNPVYATLISAAARQVPALGLVLFDCVVVEDERSAGGWHAEWQALRDCLRLTAGAATNAADLAEGLVVHPDRMLSNLSLTGGALVSERLNVALAPIVGKSAAKNMLTVSTRTAERTGRALVDVLGEELSGSGQSVDRDTLRGLLDPEHYTGASEVLARRVLARYRGAGVTEARR